jgi:hypothetical protein
MSDTINNTIFVALLFNPLLTVAVVDMVVVDMDLDDTDVVEMAVVNGTLLKDVIRIFEAFLFDLIDIPSSLPLLFPLQLSVLQQLFVIAALFSAMQLDAGTHEFTVRFSIIFEVTVYKY